MSLDSLGDAQLYCNGIWYQRWIVPGISQCISSSTPSQLSEYFKVLNVFGEIAFIFKIILNCQSIKKNLTETQSLTFDGGIEYKRRPIKASLLFCDVALTIAAGIGYFLLAASWATPLFFAISSVNLIRGIYSLSKNIHNLNCYNNTTNNPQKDPELHHALLKRHHAKIAKSVFDVCIGVALLGCTVLWVTCPLPAAIALLTVGVIAYFGRKKLKAYSSSCKTNVLKLFDERELELQDIKAPIESVDVEKKLNPAYAA